MCPFYFCNHLDGKERAGCFALFVFLVSLDCCVSLPYNATVCLQSVVVVFPDQVHLLFALFVTVLGLCAILILHYNSLLT